jgi:hypothetical protein
MKRSLLSLILEIFASSLMLWHNKLECLTIKKYFHPCLLFQSKTGTQTPSIVIMILNIRLILKNFVVATPLAYLTYQM